MRLLFLGLLLFITNTANAQNDIYNSEDFWQHLAINNTLKPVAKDTLIVIASNRIMKRGDIRFLKEKRNRDSLRYFIAFTHGGSWHILQVPSLTNALNYLPDEKKQNDWIVYTEGMGKIFTSDVDRGFRMAGTYHANVLLLDYPSIRTNYGLLRNYFFAIHNARIAYKDFVPVLDTFKELKLKKETGGGHVTLFFHSMGNNIVWKMVQHDKLTMLNDNLWADNLILNAACVPQRHHAKWLNKVHFAKRIYIDYNPNDRTLRGAHLVSFRKQLGERVRKPLSANAIYINFGQVAGERHSNFLTLPGHAPVIGAAIQYYRTVLHGNKAQIQNQQYFAPSAYRNIGWDLLPDAEKKLSVNGEKH